MRYFEELREITKDISPQIVDFSLPRDRGSAPTQATSNFITNREQGDWAEDLIFRAVNETSQNYVAVSYGVSDNLVAGDTGFDEFYNSFQDELDTIGKRPDLLIFKKSDFREDLGYDISRIEHEKINDYVKLAVAGLEIRSSAFLIEKYEEEMNQRTDYHTSEAFRIRDLLLNDFRDVFEDPKKKPLLTILESLTPETIKSLSFRRPSWGATERLSQVSELFKDLKEHLNIVQKRDYLSITPKIEDIKVVYKWAEKFDVPHYYFQVFFDKSYGISFKQILTLITDPDKEGEYYEISKDVKNQNKTTIKINTRRTNQVAYKVIEPVHKSVRREMRRGRLLFHVAFDGGTAYLDIESLIELLNINDF